jgi:hypothetical protein
MNAETIPLIPRGGLSALNEVEFDERHRHILDFAQASCGGPAVWRQRKLVEVRELLALALLSRRLKLQWLDVSVDLRAVVEMQVTVPCLRSPGAELEITPRAVLGVMYRQEVMTSPQPGYSFVQILSPGPVWHANVSRDQNQVLCLGTNLPVGIPLKEILLMAYGALTFQTIQLDPGDSAGVMNAAAAQWWSCANNLKKIPLSRAPFLVNSETKI